MQLARVRGSVVATIKSAGLASHKLLLLEPVDPADPLASSADPAARMPYVGVDLAGAGVGEVVLVALGSAARIDTDAKAVPTDAAVIAIVDSVNVDGRTTFDKS